VFVSYRRESAGAWAGRIADRLRQHFGARSVFVDVSNIEPGALFPKEIDDTVRRALAVLVVIDPSWTSLPEGGASHRIHEDDDWVRREIATALDGGAAVVPVLVDRARMPEPAGLPPDVRPLAQRQAIELSPVDFDADVQRLIEALERVGLQRSARKRVGVRGGLLVSAVVAALALVLVQWLVGVVDERRLRVDATGPVVADGNVLWEQFEVTNARYGACVAAGACDRPGLARRGQAFDRPDRSELPVVSVRADQAADFCAWIGRRLPTRDEWLAVATRGGTQAWPWGDQAPDVNRVNAIIVLPGAGSPPDIDPETEQKIDGLAARDSVTVGELAAAIPGGTSTELSAAVEDWPLMDATERRERLVEILTAGQGDWTEEAIEPTDVVAVKANPGGATTSPPGIHHLVGNAAEWSRTTQDGAAWDGRSESVLWVDGGSFRDDTESLVAGVTAGSHFDQDAVGFRCVGSR
jgi:formylglycine-generating enzyme required for sulfatase activity